MTCNCFTEVAIQSAHTPYVFVKSTDRFVNPIAHNFVFDGSQGLLGLRWSDFLQFKENFIVELFSKLVNSIDHVVNLIAHNFVFDGSQGLLGLRCADFLTLVVLYFLHNVVLYFLLILNVNLHQYQKVRAS